MPVRQIKQRMGGLYEAPSRATFWLIQRAGVLLGLGLRCRSRGLAILTSSTLFGLWHVVPALGAPEPGATSRPDARTTASTAAVIATTVMAGAGFAWLRLGAGSVLAPTLAHAALNMAAFAGVRITSRSTRPLRSPTPFRAH
jgi:uncharacterized protein